MNSGGITDRAGLNLKLGLNQVGYYFLAAILLLSGISKIADPLPPIETLRVLIQLPEELIIALVSLLSVLEVVLGIMLLFKIKQKIALSAALLLFIIFLVFSIYGTITGITNDCGCFGSLVKSQIGWGMIIRNAVITFFLTFSVWKIITPPAGVNK